MPVSELAEQAGVSERTLRDHFQRFVGVSQNSYGLRLRLNAVRRELQRRNPGPITDIATRYGFSHFGRFAAQYRRLFGESPSATRLASVPSTRQQSEITAAARR